MKLKFTFLCLLLAAFYPYVVQAQFINTFAGNGLQGYAGDGGVCTNAQLNSCSAVTFDGAGNVYIADMGNNVVRKVNTSGIITTIAGNSSAGYSGDGGAAIYAKLNAPAGVAVDGVGNVYISDNGNNVIRLVKTNGIISTYAGNGSAGFSGDGGPATAAKLHGPLGLAVDGAGNLYVADAGNNAVRKIFASGSISTLAGGGAEGYSGDGSFANFATLAGPSAVAIDPYGQVYIADNLNQVIRKIDTSYVIHTFAGNGVPGHSGNGGPAAAASLMFPTGVSVFGFGDVYIADLGNGRIRHVDATGTINDFAGTGTSGYTGDGGFAAMAELNSPRAVAADGVNRVYIADQGNNVIRRITATESVNTVPAAAPGLRVYPDPSTGAFSVDVPGQGSGATLTIMDVLGRVVATRQVETANRLTTYNFSGFAPGSYIIKLDGANVSSRQRLEVW